MIDGQTPINDVSGLLIPVATQGELNRAEAKNVYRAAFNYLIGQLTPADAPFTLDWMRQLHREMFGDVWAWAGRYRQHDLNIGVPWHQVEVQLYELTKCIPLWEPLGHYEVAARIHHRAVWIHPFPNGNGRWSRMLASIKLRLMGQSPTIWPDEVTGQTGVIRDEYIRAVRAADYFDFGPLIELHRRYTPE